MIGRKYVGRTPNSDASLVTKGFTESRYDSAKVTNDYLDSQTAVEAASAGLVNIAYIDGQDATRAKKSAVDAADNNYVPLTDIGVPDGGLVPLNSSAQIPSELLPALVDDSVVQYIPATIHMTANKTVESTEPKTYKAATVAVTDPGYPYQVIPVGRIRGVSSGGESVPGVRYDTVAAAALISNASSLSTPLVALSDTFVMVDVVTSTNAVPTSVTVDGVALQLLDSVLHDNTDSAGALYRYWFINRGLWASKTLQVNFSASTQAIAVGYSFRNLDLGNPFGTSVKNTGDGNSVSVGPITCPDRGVVVGALARGNGGSLSAIAGGVQIGAGSNAAVGLATLWSDETTTFSMTSASSPDWSAMATPLNPQPASTGRGKMVVLDAEDNLYGGGATDGGGSAATFAVVPTAPQNTTPSVLYGNRTLDLWLSLQAGGAYTFLTEDFEFGCLVVPAG